MLDLERLHALRYMDDDFMTVCLVDNFEGVELILRIVLGREDITVKSIRTQELLKNLQGRSAVLANFSCTNPEDMNYEALAKRARYFKQDEEGVVAMCKILEDMRNEAALDSARETARRMIKMGKLSLEEIADYIPALSFEELKEIEAEVMQLA